MNQETKRSVTVEDLLRLKKSERPAPEFWAAFDRELRAKQLAALVEKRPWWRTLNLSRAGRSLVRYHLPIGATAILAIAYVATRDSRPLAAIESSATHSVAVTDTATMPSAAAAVAPVNDSTAVAVSEETAPNATALEATYTSSNEAAAATVVADVAPQPETPSARYIAANLRAAQLAEPVVARGLLAQAHGFEARGLPAKPTVEPLAQMTTPAAARTARLNSAMLAAFMNERSTRTSDRVAHRLSNDGDDRLYETASRLVAKANTLGLKF
jgi:hypothetical protein